VSRWPLLIVLALTGCAAPPDSDVGSTSSHDAVIKVYDRDLQLTQPRACAIHLLQRATDESARTVEYDARVGEHAASIVYSIVAASPYPLQVSLYDPHGANTFSVAASDHALQVLGPGGALLRSVDGYDQAEAQTTVTGSGPIDDRDGLTLLGCALAGRAELGAVPAFLRNLASGGLVPGQPDVGHSTENPTPILPDWMGSVSLLGSFWLMSSCLDTSGWHCGCGQGMNDPVVGPVAGWCP